MSRSGAFASVAAVSKPRRDRTSKRRASAAATSVWPTGVDIVPTPHPGLVYSFMHSITAACSAHRRGRHHFCRTRFEAARLLEPFHRPRESVAHAHARLMTEQPFAFRCVVHPVGGDAVERVARHRWLVTEQLLADEAVLRQPCRLEAV